MKDNKRRIFLVAMSLALGAALPQFSLARGGGGGFHGGGGGGGFRGDMGGYGGGMRDFGGAGLRDDSAGMRDAQMHDNGFAGGMSDRGGFGDRGDFGSGMDGAARPYGGWGDGGNRADAADRNSWTNQDWVNHPDQAFQDHTGWWDPGTASGAARSGLASDGGLGRISNTAAGRNGNITNHVPDTQLTAFGANARSAWGNYHGNWGNWRNRWDRWPYWGAWGWGGFDDWGDLAGYWDVSPDDPPVDYDYGNNITYQGDTVYYGSQPMESASDYYYQAQTLAGSMPNVYYVQPPAPQAVASTPAKGTPVSTSASSLPPALTQAPPKDFKSLGVFSLMQQGQADSTMLFQLDVNKQGAIRGTYYNALSNEAKPVKGAVDKKNGRAAWTIGDNKTVVYDTGVSNLLKSQAPILVHFNKSNTEQWVLVKLQQPDKQADMKTAGS